VIDKIHAAVDAGLADLQLKSRLAELGDIPAPMTPAEFRQYIATETEKWGQVVKFANVKPE
jgi:tripartite-type tricarboxylate transporter receptor subunit TctC